MAFVQSRRHSAKASFLQTGRDKSPGNEVHVCRFDGKDSAAMSAFVIDRPSIESPVKPLLEVC
jgi:hypothetical protein